jgi:FAD:protein FMN transferase
MRAALVALVLLASGAFGEEALQRFVYEKAEMGLPFRVTLYAPDEATAKAAADAAFDRIAQLNSVLSDYDPDSEISRLSRTFNREVAVSTDLWNVLERAQAMSARSDGAFDVTVGPLVNLWRRARRKKELPSQELIAEMKARVGWKFLELKPETRSAKLLKQEMRLDCGSIGKAYAVDAALKVLRDRGITRVLVAGGGDMAAGDPPPGKEGWKIEAAPLDAPDAPKGEIVLLNNSAIATSGDFYQHAEINGVRYSHIVNPHTGLGLTDHSLVTILASDCATANSLSTTVGVLGPERGIRLIEDTPSAAGRILRKPSDRIEVLHSSRWPSPH